ncbi:nucleoside 2-deoxyribosyltransferase [Paraburkholderia sediminicola]|uniref:nucleoside 2-deoxyribosyltransferase n=1 Tax=Paraburkholderia sediminicola TaxID=458836 RepID=UPI0038B779AC
MANVADFRGTGEPDCGTAFETGFAPALGKDIWGYRDHLTPLLPCSIACRQSGQLRVRCAGAAISLRISSFRSISWCRVPCGSCKADQENACRRW